MDNVLMSTEVDVYIQSMKCFHIDDIGTKPWLEWHSRLSKLNQQAILEAAEMKEESVKEGLVSSGKIPVLVHEAIYISIWKKKVLPQILKFEPNPPNSFTIYSVLYHEAVCMALLETILFHSNSCEALDEASIDLLDYCCEVVTQILGYVYVEPKTNENSYNELLRQKSDLEFDIGIRGISVLRYFAEYLESMPLSIASRMYSSLDVPLLFVELIQRTPWIRKNDKDDIYKYIGGKWQKVSGEALIKFTQTEAQIWIGLRQLLLDPNCLTHYDMNDFRKNQLLKLQKYLHEDILDQLSPLIELKRWLCQLATSSLPPGNKPPIMLEIIPQMKESILKQYQNQWKAIAKHQTVLFFKQDHNGLVEMAQSLSDAYSSEILEKFENTSLSVCGGCGGNAIQKCSRCKNEWYCSRNCQVKHWPQHKEKCDIYIGQN